MPVKVKIAAAFDISQVMRETHRLLSIIEAKKPELMDQATTALQSYNDNIRQALVQGGVDPTPRAPANVDENELRDFIDAWLRHDPKSTRQEAEREYMRIKSEEIH